MAVSKRVRYEVLRRDGHRCRYCGGTAPVAVLTIDHVVPVALGGSDAPSNLVAACRDCNSGKTSTTPDAPLVADVNAHALKWAEAMRRVAEERSLLRADRQELERSFLAIWKSWTYGGPNLDRYTHDIPSSFGQTIARFVEAGIELPDLEELVDVAMESNATDKWRYFCGCAWRRIREAQERATEILQEDEADGGWAAFHEVGFSSTMTPAEVYCMWESAGKEWLEKTGYVLAKCICGHKFCGDYACMLNLASMASGAMLGTEIIHESTGVRYEESEDVHGA